MRRLLVFVSLVFGLAFSAVQADELVASLERAKAAATNWKLPPFEAVFSDGNQVTVSEGHLLQIGRKFSNEILSSDPNVRRAALDFVFLHELRHIHQQGAEHDALGDVTRRPLMECLADLEAARALIGHGLDTVDLEHRDDLARAAKFLTDFRNAWSDLVRLLPEKSGIVHLSKRERVLAMQFGIWRAYADKLNMAPDKYQVFARSIASKAGITEKPLGPWDISICRNILGWDQEPLASIRYEFVIPDNYEGFTSSFKIINNSHRDVIFRGTFLAGFYPTGKKDSFEQYSFLEASSKEVLLKAGASTLVDATLPFFSQRIPEGYELFVWNNIPMPGFHAALVSAEFYGEFKLPPTCADYFATATESGSHTFLDMARIGDYAPERFEGLFKRTFNTIDIITPLTIPVRGVEKAEVYIELAWVVLTLYSGPDKERASQIYTKWAGLTKALCQNKSLVHEWISKDDGSPNLVIGRLTQNSSASLNISNPSEKRNDYTVTWRIQYVD